MSDQRNNAWIDLFIRYLKWNFICTIQIRSRTPIVGILTWILRESHYTYHLRRPMKSSKRLFGDQCKSLIRHVKSMARLKSKCMACKQTQGLVNETHGFWKSKRLDKWNVRLTKKVSCGIIRYLQLFLYYNLLRQGSIISSLFAVLGLLNRNRPNYSHKSEREYEVCKSRKFLDES